MATCVDLVATTPSTSNTTSYASASFTPVANDLLVVFVTASGTVASAPTLTDSLGAVTFTLIATCLKNASADSIYCFAANQLAAASARTLTFACTQDAATGCIIQICRVAGMSLTGASAVRQSKTAPNQAAGTPTITFTSAVLTGNPTLAVVGNSTSPATMTPPTSWTEREDQGYSTPSTGAEYVTRDSGFTGTTITWGSSSASAFGVIAIELDTSSPIAATINGTGALSATLSGSGALASTMAGASDLPATLSGDGALAVTMTGAGDLSGTLTNQQAGGISCTMAGAAGFSAGLAGDGALVSTMAGAATSTATLTGTGFLAVNIAGVAAMNSTLVGSGALAVNIAALGSLAATLAASAALAANMAGAALLSGTLTGNGALALTAAGVATSTASLAGSGALAVIMAGRSDLIGIFPGGVLDPRKWTGYSVNRHGVGCGPRPFHVGVGAGTNVQAKPPAEVWVPTFWPYHRPTVGQRVRNWVREKLAA